jgi:hypothetical protein
MQQLDELNVTILLSVEHKNKLCKYNIHTSKNLPASTENETANTMFKYTRCQQVQREELVHILKNQVDIFSINYIL